MKTLSVYRPNTLQNALSDFDRYFESFFGDSILSPATRLFNHMPAVDIQETENAYILDMELPGYDEKNIDVHIDGTSLTINTRQESAAQGASNEACCSDEACSKEVEKKGTYLLRERKINSFTRSFKLPENADPEAVNAVFSKGILNLEIKKRGEAQKRAIQINAV